MRHFLAPEAFTREPPPELDPATFSIPGTDVERTVEDGEIIDLGGREFKVIHTPGHSAGSISFLEEETGILIAGDAIYEGPLFAHHEGGSPREYRQTLELLNDLVPHVSVVYPSHNRYPLDPEFIWDVHQAIEAIWEGRSPDERFDGLERFHFERFSFTFRDGWDHE
jgi:glyoxylase-like metal-dependent hydrolase (beta-lactamase superfamily II)